MVVEEAEDLYQEIANLSIPEIEELLKPYSPAPGHIICWMVSDPFITGANDGDPTLKNLTWLCECEMKNSKTAIKAIAQKNLTEEDFIKEVVKLIAPIIDKLSRGYDEMAIVGIVTILCKKGNLCFD